jgi:hypothetical protein
MNAQFLAIARDPSIIPGVHHYCDEWCDFCPVPKRCLAYRCTAEFRAERGRAPGEPTFTGLEEAITFYCRCLTRSSAALTNGFRRLAPL